MPAKRKEVSPAASPEKPAEAPDEPENTLQQYLNVLSIADGLASMKTNYDANTDRDALQFFAKSVLRKLSSLTGQYQYNKDTLMCIFHLSDLRYNRPIHDPEKPFEVWVRQNDWATKLNRRPEDKQRLVLSVFEEMDKMFKQHFSSQRAEDIAEGVNEVLNDLAMECIFEAYAEDQFILMNNRIKGLEHDMDVIIEYLVDSLEGQLSIIEKSLAEA